jgi:hypothetical protein
MWPTMSFAGAAAYCHGLQVVAFVRGAGSKVAFSSTVDTRHTNVTTTRQCGDSGTTRGTSVDPECGLCVSGEGGT